MKFTVARSKRTISKKFSLDGNNELVKEDGGNLTLATFDTQSCPDITTLYNYMISDECSDKSILIPGITQFDSGLIITKSEIKSREDDNIKQNLVSRSKDHFYYNGSSGFILLDYDPSPDYKANINGDGKAKPLSKDELFAILYDTLPELKNAPMIWKTSSSSNIVNKDTGHVYKGVSGQHIFVEIQNTSDIERIVSVFYRRLWLAGHGYMFMDKTGRLHDRSIIDKVVNSPEREIFLKADCSDPLIQKTQYEVINPKKKPLVTESISDLSIVENDKFIALVRLAKADASDKSEKVRKDYVQRMYGHLALNPSKLNECIQSHILYSDFPIILSNGVEITVHDIFTDPDKYDGEYCFDPFEPEYGGEVSGSTKAWIDVGGRKIFGHAHGGTWYDLEFSDRKSPTELAVTVCDIKDHNIMFKNAALGAVEMRYIQTEIDQLVTLISKFAHLKVGSCRKAFSSFYKRLGGDYGNGGGSDGFGGGEGIGGVEILLDSPAIDEEGNVHKGMESSSISLPINLKFPHTKDKGEVRYNLDTFENFEFMMKIYRIKFSYDVIFKTPQIEFPREEISDGDDKVNASMSRLKSLCVLNGLGKDSSNYAIELINGNQLNPVLDWVRRCKWDGKSRLDLIYDSIDIAIYGENEDDGVNIEFSEQYKREVIRLWMLQCIAALDGATNSPLRSSIAVPKYEHILVFVGGQGVQKTKFIKSLLPSNLNEYVLTGHELDVKDKDNVKIAISHWITELGELDSTFRKSDISSLKAFMSKESDQIRMPYAHAESNFKRRTSFCGTVNDVQFLVDRTGNRRYLPMEVNGLLPLNQIWFDRDCLVDVLGGGKDGCKERREKEIKEIKESKGKNEKEAEGKINTDFSNRTGGSDSDNDSVWSGSIWDSEGSNDVSRKNSMGTGNDVDNSKATDGVRSEKEYGSEGFSRKGQGEGGVSSGEKSGTDFGSDSSNIIGIVGAGGGIVGKSQRGGFDVNGEPKVVDGLDVDPDRFKNPNYKAKKSFKRLNDKFCKKDGRVNLGSEEECQQLWSEVYYYYGKGEQWWPCDSLEEKLGIVMGTHDRVDPIVEPLETKFDLVKNDDWRDCYLRRGYDWIDADGEFGTIGQAYRFVVLTHSELARECGLDCTNALVMSKVSNYLSTKGFRRGSYRCGGSVKKGIKICLNRGYELGGGMSFGLGFSV